MSEELSNSRIAKNTLLLYFRMIILLIVSLYTCRIILDVLGIENYGLYNVVGGIVTVFTFLSSAMGNSTQRYITCALGKGNDTELKDIFGTTCLIHWLLAVIILILSETIGLWFFFHKMVIPPDRIQAAFWVFQASVVACMVSIISIPYNALVIAHEQMGTFALLSIFYTFAKLGIVFIVKWTLYDKLVMYAILLLVIQICDRLVYQFYCKRKFFESRDVAFRKTQVLKEMAGFAGWSILPYLATISYTQGLNILLNMFFGPTVNAAHAVAVQVQGVIKNFITNFQTAVSPQIIKSYVCNNQNRLHRLIFSSSKLSFYLLLCMALPVILEADYLLSIWLKDVPSHTTSFLRLIILATILDPLANPLCVANHATGKIRRFNVVESSICLAIIPVSYVFLKVGFAPESVFVIQFILSIIVQFARVAISRKQISFTYLDYWKQILGKVLVVSIVSPIIPYILYRSFPSDFWSFILVVVVSIICVCTSACYLGLNSYERNLVQSKIIEIKNKFKK